MAPVSGLGGFYNELLRYPRRVSTGKSSPEVVFSLVPKTAGVSSAEETDCGSAEVRGDRITPFWDPRFRPALVYTLAALRRNTNFRLLLPAGEDQFSSIFKAQHPSVLRRVYVLLHQPPIWHKLNWAEKGILSSLGGIIVLSKEQQEYFSEIKGTDIIRIHHGVETTYFTPGKAKLVNRNQILFVGQWMRDFATLRKIMLGVWEQAPAVRLSCIVPRVAWGNGSLLALASDPRVTLQAGLGTDELLAAYRQSLLLLLPLTASTANNSLLEAISVGLPVIASRVGGVGDYLTSEMPGCFLFRTPTEAVAKIISAHYAADLYTVRGEISEIARKLYTWQIIVRDLVGQIMSCENFKR